MDENQNTSHPLTKERKVGFLFLLIFAILTVSLGALQLRNTIYGPFVVRGPDKDVDTNFVLADENTRLQQIDTDLDGLNDYEELYFFETSPYIEDTDSDGINDKEEIDAGEDPLCPIGEDCTGTPITDTKDIVDVGTEIANVETPTEVIFNGDVPDIAGPAPSFDLEELASNPDLLRQTILTTGQISPEELEKISDEQLLESVKGLLKNEALTTQ
jgi:hypothetical protein